MTKCYTVWLSATQFGLVLYAFHFAAIYRHWLLV